MATTSVDQVTGYGETVAYKAPCRLATTANIALSGLQTIDGSLTAANDRVLVKDQTDPRENGIYIASTGLWMRSRDMDSNRDLSKGTNVAVTDGTVGAGQWQVTTENPVTIGTANIAFARLVQSFDADLVSWAAITRPAAFDAFVATPTAANLRSMVGGVTGTGSLVFADTPTLVTPNIGAATAASISMSGGAGVSHTFTGSGLAANIWVNQSSAALSATVPEIGAQFTMSSNLGIANQTTAYKIAATFSVIGGASSACIYGTNTIVQGHAGAGGYLVTGNEVDINNVGATAATLGSGTASYGFIAVAAGGFDSTAAFSATGSGINWTYGFATWLNGVKAVTHSDFRAESTATNILTATGARTNGVDLSGATFSNHAFESPGFFVSGTGSVSALGIQFAGSTAVAGPSVFQNSNILTFGGGTSGHQWMNQAIGAQLMALSNTGVLTVLGSVTGSSSIKSNSPTGGIGYATGAGGSVTQATSKSTAVALATMCGQITMNAAALAAGAIVSFTWTNANIGASDVVVLNHIFGGTIGAYTLNAQCGAGSAQINVRNNTAGSLSDAIVIQFTVIKGVNS
ncbi:hypothetical protein ACFX5Q_07295 [Mesorhizobium sp. IMUNJ 23033]|uniref:hypothetical protein n=1 Tax=Mesorhizobium sp. IMUNJ 23033 TaxID=3378039 RepID=UPI00384B9CE9